MDTEISIARVLLSFLLVCGLIGLCALALKWLSHRTLLVKQLGTNRRLKLLETSSLDHKHKCFLLACDEQEYVVVSNGTQMEVLDSKEKIKEGDNADR